MTPAPIPTHAGWPDPEDPILARSIFGTDDLAAIHRMLAAWVAEQGFGPARIVDIELSVGAAIILTRAGGERLFVKVWPASVDAHGLAAQMALQREMSRRGFPAPAVVTTPLPLGTGWAVAMAYDRSGDATDAARPEVRRAMAAGLARFVAETGRLRMRDALPRRALPAADAIWPRPHSVLFDFAATRQGAGWIDAIASNALILLRTAPSRLVVGHCDWSVRNMRMHDREIAVVYDWDSVFLEEEAIVVGSAAANFTSIGGREAAAFVRDYEQARDISFTPQEIEAIQAAAGYARAYTARCEHAIDPDAAHWHGSHRERLKADGTWLFQPHADGHA